MTPLPDWLVERAALDEVGPASRARLERADASALAERIAQLRDDNATELAHYPAGPAVALLRQRADELARRKAAARRRRYATLAAVLAGAAAVVAVLTVTQISKAPAPDQIAMVTPPETDEVTRVKGAVRLLAFRQVGDKAERLVDDVEVHAGDHVQLRYNPGGQKYGVIASIDGAGVVTLHYPLDEDAAPEATAVTGNTTTLPNAFELDDAPRFERFFFFTAGAPIDVQRTLEALRVLAHRDDAATAKLELPPGMQQSTLRLRKPAHSTETP